VIGGWASISNPLATSVACALALVLAGALLIMTPRIRPPDWFIALAAIACPVIVLLQGVAQLPSPGVLGQWAPVLTLGLLVVIAAIGPSWAWLAALVSWIACQLLVDGSLSWPGAAAILLAGLFRRVMQRSGETYASTLAELAQQETAGGLTLLAISEVQQKFEPLAHTEIDSILGGIADGSLQADAPEVRRKCAALDGYIRALLRLEPSRDVLHAIASEVALKGIDGDCVVDIALPSETGWAQEDREELGGLAAVCVEAMQGSTLRITGGVEDHGTVARFVGSFADRARVAQAATFLRSTLAPHAIRLSVTQDETSGSVMVEFRNRGYFANGFTDGRMQPGAHR